jgi:diguanylate cyclase (GGDEF)-like protein
MSETSPPGRRLSTAALLVIATAALLQTAAICALPHGIVFAAFTTLAAVHLLALASALLSCTLAKVYRHISALHERLTRAETDPVTGLPIRRVALDAIAGADRGVTLTVAVADINHFHEINNGPGGHAAGDLYLAEVAARLTQAANGTDMVARLGGDELILISRRHPAQVAASLTAALTPTTTIAGVDRPIDVSIGICQLAGGDPHQLIGCADLAMFTAKRRRSGIELYDAARDGVPLPADVRPAVRPRDRHRTA